MSDSFCRKSISLNLLATSEIVPLRPSSACLVSKGVQREMCNLYCLKKNKKKADIYVWIYFISNLRWTALLVSRSTVCGMLLKEFSTWNVREYWPTGLENIWAIYTEYRTLKSSMCRFDSHLTDLSENINSAYTTLHLIYKCIWYTYI